MSHVSHILYHFNIMRYKNYESYGYVDCITSLSTNLLYCEVRLRFECSCA